MFVLSVLNFSKKGDNEVSTTTVFKNGLKTSIPQTSGVNRNTERCESCRREY